MMLKQKVAGESNRCSRCGRTIEYRDHIYLRTETDGEVHSVQWTCVFCGSAHNEGYAKAQAAGVFEARGMTDEIVELRKQINSLEGLLNCRTGIDAYDKGYDQGRSDASPLPKEGRESEGGTAQDRMWSRWHDLLELRDKGEFTNNERLEYDTLNALTKHLDMVDETETLKGRIDHLERLVDCDQRLWDAAKAAMQAIVAHQQNSTCEITSREELASHACEISEALVVEFDNRVRG